MIVWYLNSAIFRSGKTASKEHIFIKSFVDKSSKIYKVNTTSSITGIHTPFNKTEKDLISFRASIKNIRLQERYLSQIEQTENNYFKINFFSTEINNYHYKLLFDTWEYRNFRGVPNADLWKSIHAGIHKLQDTIKSIRTSQGKENLKLQINFSLP